MKILILGVTGMLGNAVFNVFSKNTTYEVFGTTRSPSSLHFFSDVDKKQIITGVDVLDVDSLLNVFKHVKPELVINCIGITNKQSNINDPLVALPINAMLPHRLSTICATTEARLIHVSTDCVFSGEKGNYNESGRSDADSLYGQSKYLGELHTQQHAITLRTSIIGHGLSTHDGLIDWFLLQEGCVKGYTKAIFSGLPTVVLAKIMMDVVVPNPSLSGLYHVSANPIDKFKLLSLVSEKYEKDIKIIPDDSLVIDRSLDSSRFTQATGYIAPRWNELIKTMYENYKGIY